MPYKEIETSQNKSFSHNPIINSLLLITLKSREGSRTDFKWNPSCKSSEDFVTDYPPKATELLCGNKGSL